MHRPLLPPPLNAGMALGWWRRQVRVDIIPGFIALKADVEVVVWGDAEPQNGRVVAGGCAKRRQSRAINCVEYALRSGGAVILHQCLKAGLLFENADFVDGAIHAEHAVHVVDVERRTRLIGLVL